MKYITIECFEAKLHDKNQPGLQTTHKFCVLNSQHLVKDDMGNTHQVRVK